MNVLRQYCETQDSLDNGFAQRLYTIIGRPDCEAHRSNLTQSGRNIEFSIPCGGSETQTLRYTVDGTSGLSGSQERLAECDRMTTEALKLLGAKLGLDAHESIMNKLMRVRQTHSAMGDFAIWHGVVHKDNGDWRLKAYYNLRPWEMMRDKLLGTLKSCQVLGRIERLWKIDDTYASWPCFLGVEYGCNGVHASKLYWQRRLPLPWDELQSRFMLVGGSGSDEILSHIWYLVMENKEALPAHALVLSSKISEYDDSIELGLHLGLPSFCEDDNQASELIKNLLKKVNIDASAYQNGWEMFKAYSLADQLVHSVLAIILTANGPRITVYFDPASKQL